MAALTESIEGFKSAGYDSLPTHCQEALLRFEMRGADPVNLRGFKYDEGTRGHVAQFIQDMQDMSVQLQMQGEAPQLREKYGDTYMFFYYFGQTPEESAEAELAETGFGGSVRQE
jgi:hypothetical protein